MQGRFLLIVLASLAGLAAAERPVAAASPEWILVTQEACGSQPQAKCLTELKKICHEHPTFRCYYSKKSRLDAVKQVGFPEQRSREEEW